ncbi:hypothetical protein OAV88_01250 [bacterium]|nr:hypothetical protein [bacterium]
MMSEKEKEKDEIFEKKEEACMKLLKGHVDEEKLSGLLLSAKYLLPSARDDTRRNVFAAAGRRFFDRLAKTDKMRHVFLAVMCSLLEDRVVLKEYEKSANMFLDFAVNAARNLVRNETDELAAKTFGDAVNCLHEIAKSNNLMPICIVQYVLYILWILRALKRGNVRDIASNPCQRLASLLLNQLGKKKDWPSDDTIIKEPSNMFYMAADIFQSYEPPIKWNILSSMTLILRFEYDVRKDLEKSLLECKRNVKWEECIRNGIQEVWVVRNLPSNLRFRCFELSAMLTSLTTSIQWACEDTKDREKRGKFLTLWISLAANELKICLDMVTDAMENATLKQSSSIELKEEFDDSIAAILMRTLNSMVSKLCVEEGDFVVSEFVSSTTLLSILRVLRQSNEMILGFIASYLRYIQDISTASSRLDVLADECMRAIGRYILEDTDEIVVKPFAEILPRLCVWESQSLQYILPALHERKDLLNSISIADSDALFLQLFKMIPNVPIAAARLCCFVAHDLLDSYKTDFKFGVLKRHASVIRSLSLGDSSISLLFSSSVM